MLLGTTAAAPAGAAGAGPAAAGAAVGRGGGGGAAGAAQGMSGAQFSDLFDVSMRLDVQARALQFVPDTRTHALTTVSGV